MLREYNTLHAIQAGDTIKTKSGVNILIVEVSLEINDDETGYNPEISINVPFVNKTYFVEFYLSEFLKIISADIYPETFLNKITQKGFIVN